MPRKRVNAKKMSELETLKREETEFLKLFPDAMELDAFAGVSFEEPKSVARFLLSATFDLQRTSVLLGAYTSENPAPVHVTKAVAELHFKLARDLDELNLLASQLSKEQKPCCRMSAILEDPMTRRRCRAEIQHLLSRVLEC